MSDSTSWLGPILGAITGGTITLGVTFLQNRQHVERLERQFFHDREMKKEDRYKNLKRDIYFDALLAINTFTHALNNFSDLDFKNNPFNAPVLSTKLQKVQLVASKKILEAFGNISNPMLEGFFSALPSKMKHDVLLSEKAAQADLLSFYQERQKYVGKTMEDLNRENNITSSSWPLLREESAKLAELINKMLEENDVRNHKIYEARTETQNILRPFILNAAERLGDLILLLREELDAHTDAELLDFIKTFNKASREKALTQLSSFENFADGLINKEP